MTGKKKSVDGANLSDAIRSLQNLLDDVSANELIAKQASNKADEPAAVEEVEVYEETVEVPVEDFDEPDTSARSDEFDIDSHFDMNIPPALPDDDEDETDDIPTLSETIVEGDIPVLKEIVKLPDGSMIPEPAEISLETAIQNGNLPTPISDAAEAAADAVQIILARYQGKPMTTEVREKLMSAIQEILTNSPELEIPDSIL
jgi:hypothetical protein